MSDTIITLLNSDDASQRKKGIGAAAKSVDKRYLKPLATIYKTDPDPTLRELAKKAGVYINKNQPVLTNATAGADDSFVRLREAVSTDVDAPLPTHDDSMAALRSEAAPLAPLPSADELLSSLSEGDDVDIETAQFHYNTAFDLHLKGNDARAALELGTAFHLNPAFAADQTAVAFAAELTGKPLEEAAGYIGDPQNWEAITEMHGGIQRTAEERQWMQQFAIWLAVAVLVIFIVVIGAAFVQGEVFEAALQQVTEDIRNSVFGEGGMFADG